MHVGSWFFLLSTRSANKVKPGSDYWPELYGAGAFGGAPLLLAWSGPAEAFREGPYLNRLVLVDPLEEHVLLNWSLFNTDDR